MSARQVGNVPVLGGTPPDVATTARTPATAAPRGNAAAQDQVKAAQAGSAQAGSPQAASAQPGGVRGWLAGVGQAAVDTTSRAMDSVGEAWSAVKTAGQEVSAAIADSGIEKQNGVVSAHTDLDTIAPLLPAAWGAALGKGPADPAANRVGVSMDVPQDRLTLSIPDLRLSGMSLGGYRVGSLAVSGVVLTLDNAGGVARSIAARKLGGGMLDGLVSQASSPKVGAVRLTVEHLLATGVKGPGGGVGRIEAEGLDATVGSDSKGMGGVADSPLGVSGAFRLRSLTVGALDAGDTHADAVSASGIRLDGQADTGAASLAVGTAGVKNLRVAGSRVGSGSVSQLTASADLNGAAHGSKGWEDVVDPARAEGKAALGAAHVTAATVPGGAVGQLDAKGVSAAHGPAGDRASVQAALATDVAAGGAKIGRATMTDASVSSTAARKDAHVGLLEVGKVSGGGASVGSASVRDANASVVTAPGGASGNVSAVAASGHDLQVAGSSVGDARATDVHGQWSGAGASGRVGDVSADKVAIRLPGTQIDAATVSGHGLSGGRDATGIGGRAQELAAGGVRVDYTAAAQTPGGNGSTVSAAGKRGTAAADKSGSGMGIDPVALAGLVQDADIHATAPLGARRYGGDFLGATVKPGTQATANVSVHDGKIVPKGTNLTLNKGLDGPAWVEGDGAYMTRGPGETGRVNVDLGGAPDVDVTKYIPGVESGVPLGVSDLARRYAPGAGGAAPASPGAPSSDGGTSTSEPAPVDVAHLSGSGAASLKGGFDVGAASGVLAGERAGDNRVSGSVKDGGKNIAVEFIRLLVGSLRVRAGDADASAQKVTASSGKLSVDTGAGARAHGEIGAVKIEGAEAHLP